MRIYNKFMIYKYFFKESCEIFFVPQLFEIVVKKFAF